MRRFIIINQLQAAEWVSPRGFTCPVMQQLTASAAVGHGTGPRLKHDLLQGIYHRDLRMENLLLDGQYNSPNLKISDFAYSKNAVLDSQPKTNVGSPSYTPPELLLAVRNEGSAYDGAAIDVWSSGVILFFMLTGQLPFQVSCVKPPPYRHSMLD